MSVAERERLGDLVRKLEGSTFGERLHRWVGVWSLRDYDEGPEGRPVGGEHAMRLAEEGFLRPDLLRSELDWLTSPNAESIVWFARRLGELDVSGEWLV